ncbi:FAD-binding oxidoreductase [Luteipulveratus sp. YIM 133132]|uniref:FAD-binding oxidoreductase n=1 Tax=Luteipulveratus flavus TaxID=3031728 RepID=UPI0023B188DD|nr:FAD-binding oxidoreductase [Luteipulveratus sp. YIM 133132]MDE9364061.1 FAD-binding oxidoreductase [Luteipulveratus sp. YIM 133132]
MLDRLGDIPHLRPGDDGYDASRSVWNAIVEHRPAVIVRPTTVEQVQQVVRLAREHDLLLGIRCGGHSAVGHSVPDQGLMLDLTALNAVRVDPRAQRARVQGGALLGALDRATQRHGLAVTAGNVSHTGVSGLTLGGGFGWLARKFGLACDNVESFRLVTADGTLVTASATEHPDLYWGLRGGGGNFGVVTEFEMRLHETGTRSLTVEVDFALDEGAEVMGRWRDLLPDAPREATFTADIGAAGILTVGYVWTGDPDFDGTAAAALVPQIRALGRAPLAERVLDRSYLDLQTQADVVHAHSLRRYSKSHYLADFPDAAVEAFVLRGSPDGRPDGDVPLPTVGLQAYGGAVADVPDEDSAFSHRGTLVEYGGGLVWEDPALDAPYVASARRAGRALEPYASGVYVNAMSDEGAAGVRRAYSADKLARLTALKDAWDPDNVFRLNANIPPSAAGRSTARSPIEEETS